MLGVYQETKTKHDNVPVYKQAHSIRCDGDMDHVGLLYRENGHWWIYWNLTVDSSWGFQGWAQSGYHPKYRSRDGGDEPPEQGWQVSTGHPSYGPLWTTDEGWTDDESIKLSKEIPSINYHLKLIQTPTGSECTHVDDVSGKYLPTQHMSHGRVVFKHESKELYLRVGSSHKWNVRTDIEPIAGTECLNNKPTSRKA